MDMADRLHAAHRLMVTSAPQKKVSQCCIACTAVKRLLSESIAVMSAEDSLRISRTLSIGMPNGSFSASSCRCCFLSSLM